MKKVLMVALLCLGGVLHALEFESGGTAPAPKSSHGQSGGSATVPTLIDAGDVPTAYSLLKYEMRADLRFYNGGGIVNTVNFGIFSRFYLGGALNVPGLVNQGPVTLEPSDASLIAKLVAVEESAHIPAIAVGWEGPQYDMTELRGLYIVASKEFDTPLGYFQLHGGLNNAVFQPGWQGSRDLRGFMASTASYSIVTGFCELDELNNPMGPHFNAGVRIFFDPVSLGLEFQNIGAFQKGEGTSRMLRASYSGLF